MTWMPGCLLCYPVTHSSLSSVGAAKKGWVGAKQIFECICYSFLLVQAADDGSDDVDTSLWTDHDFSVFSQRLELPRRAG
jgi:hypothetical protein